MILLNSNYYRQLDASLNKAWHNNDVSDWQQLIKNIRSDGFLNILNNPIGEQILQKNGFSSIKDFFLNIEDFVDDATHPDNYDNVHSMVLFQLWNELRLNLMKLLNNSRQTTNIPENGGLFVYLGGLSICLIIKFNRKLQRLKIVDIIENPQSVFDFWGSINQASVTNKNILKEIINSGHKLIYHRGVLIHIDRRKDTQVFGPSIDTLLMNEILCQKFFENNLEIKSATEVGCGNGLLSVSLAKYSEFLERLDVIDINFNAIFCTHKNLESNLSPYLLNRKGIFKINGKFTPSNFSSSYDLVVCNPPYIPIPKADRNKRSHDIDYYTAVGGLEVIDMLLENISLILEPKGKLFLLISHLTEKHFLEKIDEEMHVEYILENGHEVLFDVEAVFNQPRWLNYLKDNYGLPEREGAYFHNIIPLIISKK